MSVLMATIILLVLMLVFIALGLPIAFALGGSAVIFGTTTMGWESLYYLMLGIWNNMRTIVLIAVPLFVFMGNVLQASGIAEDIFKMVHNWTGGLRGGLAVATVIVCTIFAACTGISGAATVTMGLIAIPAMLKRKYDKHLSIGCVMGGGALGQLIPPSLILILYGFMGQESVGRLFAGGIIPGLILSGMFIVYILISCGMKPSLGPSIPPEERPNLKEKFISLRAVLLPIVLVGAVLGSIFTGIATPTEAAAVGAAGAIICALVNGKLTLTNFKAALHSSIALSAMIMWIVVGATAFTLMYSAAGGPEFIKGALLGMNVSPIVIIIMMQFTFIMLGMFMDPSGIILLCTPIFVPIVRELGFDTVWFGVLFCVNMEMAYLTPPYGGNLFYMRGVTPPSITMKDIYISAIPFLVIQFITLVLVMFFPAIVTFLPDLVFGAERFG
ncbi:TRAP transporter large permease subunit [Chloroflexota bacterium]